MIIINYNGIHLFQHPIKLFKIKFIYKIHMSVYSYVRLKIANDLIKLSQLSKKITYLLYYYSNYIKLSYLISKYFYNPTIF
jgi:hypothetical protein